jgi:hypothetical protein
MKHLPSTLRVGDRVRHRNGRHGGLDGIFADTVALVFWEDQGPPSYESLDDLSKLTPEKSQCAAQSLEARSEIPPHGQQDVQKNKKTTVRTSGASETT